MSTPAQKDSERSSRQRGSSECKSLIDAATKDLFHKNAFRITGLSVDATIREVAKHAKELTLRAELGQDPHTQGAAFPMKPPPSLDEIREAIQKLKDPEKRLIDEFFWFWPEEFGQSQSDPAIQALAKGDSKTAIGIWSAKEKSPTDGVVAAHNLALVFYIKALDWENYSIKHEVEAERRQKITDYWKGAFNRWERLATDERLWEKVTARIHQLNEPNLPTGFARRMRATLPEALDKINAELALAFAESGKIELARLHIRFMRETNQGLDNVEKTNELVLTPARNRLKEQIKQAKERAKGNPQDAASAAKELLQQAQRSVFLFDLFFGKDNELRNDLFDEVAAVCNQLQVAYYKVTNDDSTCLDILKKVLPLATSIELRQQIEENVGALTGFAADKKLEPAYALLKSIQDSKDHPCSQLTRFNTEVANVLITALAGLPRGSDNCNQLWDSAAIVLRGISLDAWNKHEDMQTAVAANELAIRHATSPELKQRLAEDKATLQQMAERGGYTTQYTAAQQSNLDILKEYKGFLVLAGIIIIVIIFNLKSCDSPTSYNPTPASSVRNTPTYTPPPSTYTPPSPSQSTPVYTPPPTYGGRNSGGNVYRVPSSVSSTLDNEKAEIESERITIEALDAQVERLGREIENDRLYLDRTSQFAIDSFNEKVDRYNRLAQRDKIATAVFNGKVENYNAKLRQYGR